MSEELQEIMESNPEWYKNLLLTDVKSFIKANIESTSRSFVAIGYYLKYVRDNELFKEDGYSGILEFAQSEFGISKSWASKWMSINDQFSVSGNSPILLDQYKDFSSSKLSEMLYLSDEQREQVTVATTKAEIREIKSPVKEEIKVNSFSPAKTEPTTIKPSYLKCAAYDFNKFGRGCDGCYYDKADVGCTYDRTDYFAELKRKEEQSVRHEVLKEMCNSICKMCSYILEKNNYSMDTIKGLSRGDQDFSFGFGDDGTEHSKFDARYKAKTNRYHVEEFHGEGKWVFEAGEVDQDIWNFNSREWKEKRESAKREPKPIDDLDLSVRTYNCLKRAGIDTVEKLCELEFQEIIHIRDISMIIIREIDEKLKPLGMHLNLDDGCIDGNSSETVNDEPEIVDNDTEIVNDVDEAVIKTSESVIEEVETVEADIIQTVPDELPRPLFSAKYHIQEAIKREEEQIGQLKESWMKSNPDALLKHETILIALKLHLTDMEYPVPEKIQPEQPELPLLRNNDQRKDFIDAYATWPIWIDTELTGERYYRYDLSDKIAMVVKVSKRHVWNNYKQTEKIDFDHEEYYLLGINMEYHSGKMIIKEDDTRTFFECGSNKSALVDYLKDIQKK